LRVQYDRVIIGGAVPAPGYALGVLVAFTAAMGLLDGVSIGAVYGEAGDTTCQMLTRFAGYPGKYCIPNRVAAANSNV
jgi:hypothetical protein